MGLDLRSSHMILEDVTSAEGVPLHRALEGEPAAGKNAHPALVAKDGTGDLVYLAVDALGQLSVTLAGAGTPKKARGKVDGDNAAFATVVDLALTAGKTYKGLAWVVSCFRDAIFEIVAINDPAGTPTEVILADALTGAGDLTDSGDLPSMVFVAGATAPILRVRAKNLNAESDFRASIVTMEAA